MIDWTLVKAEWDYYKGHVFCIAFCLGFLLLMWLLLAL